MSSQLPLITKRLILRDFVEDDWRAVHCYASDPEVVRYMSWGPNDEETTIVRMQDKLLQQKADPRHQFELAIVLQHDHSLIGSCRLWITSVRDKQGSIGYCFNRSYWGQGYATEAAAMLLSFGFQSLGLHRIFATCDVNNIASARVLEKIGMQREGLLRENTWLKDRWGDSLLYAILEHEWLK